MILGRIGDAPQSSNGDRAKRADAPKSSVRRRTAHVRPGIGP